MMMMMMMMVMMMMMIMMIVTMIKTTEKYRILRLISMEALILYLRLPCQVCLI